MGERSGRVRGVTLFNLWASLYADDCAIFFKTRQDLITGSTYLFSHLARFGLHMHVGRGSTKSKTEAMFFPKPRTPYEDADTSSLTFDFCLSTSIPVLTTSTYVVAWPQGDQFLGGGM